MEQVFNDVKERRDPKQKPVRTAGVEETSAHITGACDSNVDTAMAAATVYGGQGNQYTFNINNLTIVGNGNKQKEGGTVSISPAIYKDVTRPSGVRRESINEEHCDQPQLQVEYPVNVKHAENKHSTDNKVVRTEEAVPICESFTETKDTGLRFSEDHFGIQWRFPLGSQNIQRQTDSFKHCGNTETCQRRVTKRLDSSDDDWEMVDDTDTACCSDKNTDGCRPSGMDGAVGNDYTKKKVEGSDNDKHGIDNPHRLTAEGDDPLEITLREVINKMTCCQTVCESKVLPDDTGQRGNRNLLRNRSSGADYRDGILDQDMLRQTESEHARSSLRMVEEQSLEEQRERSRSSTSIGQSLEHCQAGDADHSMIQHVIRDMLFILQKQPTQAIKIYEEVSKITRALRHDCKGSAISTGRSSYVSAVNMDIAEDLTMELFKIHKDGLRHEAKLLIDSVMVIGRSDADKLWDLSSFLKRVKLADVLS